jgi:hypothetical protein
VAGLAEEDVGIRFAFQQVVAGAGEDPVVARPAVEDVGAAFGGFSAAAEVGVGVAVAGDVAFGGDRCG